jgi:hypothetical protein
MPVLGLLRRHRFSHLAALSQVPRVENLSWDVFNTCFVAPAVPVVITGSPLFDDGAVTLESLARPGTREIAVNVRSGDYLNVSARQEERMLLSEYIERFVRPSEGIAGDQDDGGELPRYAGNTPLTHEQFEALGFRAPDCFGDQKFDAPRLWFGPKRSATPLHYDSRDNLICQYIGRKQLTLYPPSQIPWLYTYGYAPSWSRVGDPRRADLTKFPLFARTKAVEVTLLAGEMLYLPARWSHFVVNLDTSVMVNFWPEHTPAQRARIELVTRAYRLKYRLLG